MSKTLNARFANGVFTPLEPVAFPEGTIVVLNIEADHIQEPLRLPMATANLYPTTADSCPVWKTRKRSSNSSWKRT